MEHLVSFAAVFKLVTQGKSLETSAKETMEHGDGFCYIVLLCDEKTAELLSVTQFPLVVVVMSSSDRLRRMLN